MSTKSHSPEYQDIVRRLDQLYQIRDQLEAAETKFNQAIDQSLLRGNIFFENDQEVLH